MSGFEVVGIILGLCPLVERAVALYKATKTTDSAAMALTMKLKVENLIYHQLVFRLLASDLPKESIAKLVSTETADKNGWKDPTLHGKLLNRLGREKAVLILELLDQLKGLLSGLNEDFKYLDGGMVSTSKHTFMPFGVHLIVLQKTGPGLRLRLRTARYSLPKSNVQDRLEQLVILNKQLRRLTSDMPMTATCSLQSDPDFPANFLTRDYHQAKELYGLIDNYDILDCNDTHVANYSLHHLDWMRDNYNCSSSPKNFDDSKSAGGQLESVSGSGETKLCVAKLPTTYNESCYRSARAVIRSNAPPRNVFFVGRTNYLETLRHCLSSPGQICVLSGEAGVGKTATAIEYSYKYENDLSHVFWIDAETSGGCADTYSLIASVRNRLVQGVDVLRDQNSLNHQVRKALEFTKHRWLLVFDNVKSVSTVEPYIPRGLQNTQGSVLLIARIDTLLDCPSRLRSCQALRLGAMRLDESRELLLCSVDSDADRQNLHLHRDHDRAADVARLMDGLPLSINMAAGYLRQSNCTLAEFIDIWKEWQSWSTETTQGLEAGSIISSLDILWKIEIRELPKEERHLLEILSFLDPEVIQKDLLVGNHKELALQFLNPVETNR